MALRGLGGIDPMWFGTGKVTSNTFASATDLHSDPDPVIYDYHYKNVTFSGGAPFTVRCDGMRFFATNKITIVNATLDASGFVGASATSGPNAGGAGGRVATFSSGIAGGDGANGFPSGNAGTAGADSAISIGGSGGDGGDSSSHSFAGGGGGEADPDGLFGMENFWPNLIQGWARTGNGTSTVDRVFRGGCGGGGGAAGNPGGPATNGGGGGGGGGGIILLCAPVIEIQALGVIKANGGNGGVGNGSAGGDAGGGGGGGGGVIILVYGQLINNGTIVANGGDGANAGAFGFGGKGGKAGFIYHFGGLYDEIRRDTGSDGADGTP